VYRRDGARRRLRATGYTWNMTRVLVTGANGFVGRTLCPELENAGFELRAAVRNEASTPLPVTGGDTVAVGYVGPDTDWAPALEGVDAIVHLACRVHVLRERLREPEQEFHKINVLGVERLARAAAGAGVKRMVYISSIGVNGRATEGSAFTERDKPSPHYSYAISKWDAEQVLYRIAGETGLEVVVLRPPLIYGPGVKANFLRLMKLVDSGLPLPFGSVDNRRSLIYVRNLADAISRCISSPQAAGETFLVSDGEDVSTPQLLRLISKALGRRPQILPFPQAALRTLSSLFGMSGLAEPLLGSLVVDSSKIRRTLDWQPPYTTAQGLQETARWFRSQGSLP
jgi:nucleoside-diphosphate-sugar epimerase